MCGIVGVFPINKTNIEMEESKRRLIALYLHNEVLLETVARGKDATGLTACFKAGEGSAIPFWFAIKQPVDTWDFFLNDGYDSRYKGQDEDANIERFMDVSCLVDRPMYHVIGHTRAKTVGSEYNPNNNHPILVGNIVGIHNGGVKNYKRIYDKHDKMTPQGEVDSEVIMQLLAERANNRELQPEDINYVTSKIEGPRSVLAYNRRYPGKVAFFHDKDRPLEMAYIPEIGTLIVHSEKKFLDKALHVYARARLTVRRDLPELSVDWRTVKAGEGGIIDVEIPMNDEEMTVNQMFPVFEYDDTEEEYANVTKSTTNYGNYKGTNGSSHKGTTGSTSNTSKSTTGNSSTSKGPSTNLNASSGNKTTAMATVGSPTAIPQADFEDLSTYGAEKSVSGERVETTKVPQSELMDDNDDAEFENTEPSANDVSGIYSESELRQRGASWALGEEAADDSSLFINRHAGGFNRWFSVNVKEDDAAEIIEQLFPEIFGEGFSKGFKEGASEEAESNADNDSEEKLLEMSDELTKVRSALQDERDKRRKAATFIANMKAFLMASIITCDLGSVQGEGKNAKLVFKQEIEEFLSISNGYQKANPDMVRDLFTEGDLKALQGSLTGMSRKVSAHKTEKNRSQ